MRGGSKRVLSTSTSKVFQKNFEKNTRFFDFRRVKLIIAARYGMGRIDQFAMGLVVFQRKALQLDC